VKLLGYIIIASILGIFALVGGIVCALFFLSYL